MFLPYDFVDKNAIGLIFVLLRLYIFFFVTFKENPGSLMSCSLIRIYVFLFLFFSCLGLNILHESKVLCLASEIPIGNMLLTFIYVAIASSLHDIVSMNCSNIYFSYSYYTQLYVIYCLAIEF